MDDELKQQLPNSADKIQEYLDTTEEFISEQCQYAFEFPDASIEDRFNCLIEQLRRTPGMDDFQIDQLTTLKNDVLKEMSDG